MSTVDHTSNFVSVPLTKGYTAILDNCDADLAQLNWCSLVQPTGNVYAKCARGSKDKHRTILMHRLVMARIVGRALNSDERVDHKDGNTLNNTRANLRLATHAENMRNSKRRRDNKSGYKGVNLHNGRWRAEIQHNKKCITIGMYDTPEEAYEAYTQKAKELHGEFARLE